MVHRKSNGVLLRSFVEKLTEVFGNNARIAFGYLIATSSGRGL